VNNGENYVVTKESDSGIQKGSLMTVDINSLQNSVRRKKGLMDKLGDAGRFLTGFLGGGEVSEGAVKKTIDQLQTYLASCHDQLDEVGTEWEKADRQLANLKSKLKEASRATRSIVLAQAELLLRKCDGYQSAIDKLKDNGMSAEVLVEKLRDLLILISGPLSEDRIDQWTAQLEVAIDDRAMSDKALDELERVSERSVAVPHEEPSTENVESQLEKIAGREPQTEREQAVERRLEELFDE